MTKLEALAKDCIENHTHRLVNRPTKQDIYLREESIFIQGYRLSEKRITDLENKIADIKANCDLAIEGRDVKIKELEKENERLKGDLELWESGGCRATNLFECGVVKELKEQLTKAKEIIKDLLEYNKENWLYSDIKKEAEQFLKEIEK